MKYNLTLLLLLLANVIFAQSGINTHEPKSTLDIKAKFPTGNNVETDGLLIPRIDRLRAHNMTNIEVSTLAYISDISTGTATNKTTYVNAIGFYYFDGTYWQKVIKDVVPVENYSLFNTYSLTATAPVGRSIAGTYAAPQIIDNVDISMSIPITIPANSSAKIIVNYSVPLGNPDAACADSKLSYYGIRFLKDGVEVPAGSRKVSYFASAQAFRMTSISATVADDLTNNTSSPITINYALNGYLEIAPSTISAPCSIRFNMWAASGANFNWGKATLNAQLYTKSL